MQLTPGWRLAAVFGLIIITGLIWRPAVLFGLGTAVAAIVGCEVTERGPEPCVVGGGDLGPQLYRSYVESGWGMVAAMPLMIASLVVWTRLVITWRRQRRTVSR